MNKISPPQNIVFFDGVCNLCNSFIDFVLTRDRRKVLYIASLQGETAAQILPNEKIVQLSSVVLFREQVLYENSEAIIRVISQLGRFWALFKIFLIVPTPLRDGAYRFIAKNRYRWFGKRDTCRLPTDSEKQRFLP